jgi:penicillin-binding protein 1A
VGDLRRQRLTVAVTLLALVSSACAWNPDVGGSLAIRAAAQSSKIFAADGTLITTLHAEENREDVPLSRISKSLRDAVVAIEDERYWQHQGVDVRSVLRAVYTDASVGRVAEGGSTITQQYVKNAMLDPERSLRRKIREASLAYQLERRYSKERILEGYLNTIYFGNGAYGAQAAATVYFGTTAKNLTLAQSALLAGLIRSPGAYDPYELPDPARKRRNTVIDKMRALRMATSPSADAAKAEDLGVTERPTQSRYPAAHFIEIVKQFVFDDPKFGATPAERRAALFSGGLRIHTTLNLRLQEQAELARDRVLTRPDVDPEAAIVSIHPASGHVRALVGGRDFFGPGGAAKFDLATQGRRQAGSAFKPLVLAAALTKGIPTTQVFPAPPRIVIPRPPPEEPWEVDNYEGGGGGQLDLVEATVQSVNTVYAQLILQVGPAEAMGVAQRMGIASPLRPFPSAVLGSNEVSPLDMATAYTTLANRGIRVRPVFVTKVAKADGTLLHEDHGESSRVLTQDVVDTEVAILQQAVERGTGTRARLDRPVAGKTGTNQLWRDAWFVGFTPQLVTAVWVGFFDRQRSMVPPATPIRVTGGSWPAQIWHGYMSAALTGEPVDAFPPMPTTTTTTMPTTTTLLSPTSDTPTTAPLVTTTADVPTTRRNAPTTTAVSGRTVVPNVLGLTDEDAERRLTQAGLATQRIIEEQPGSRGGGRRGRVWKQSPAGGSEAEPGSTVTIWVSPD